MIGHLINGAHERNILVKKKKQRHITKISDRAPRVRNFVVVVLKMIANTTSHLIASKSTTEGWSN